MEVQCGIGYPSGEDSLLQESVSEVIFSLRHEPQAFPDAAPKKPHFLAITPGKRGVGNTLAQRCRNFQIKS